MAIINLSHIEDAITRDEVQAMINMAVFKAGTCTPESVDMQIDAKAEVLNLNSCEELKLMYAVVNPEKYVFTYDYNGRSYTHVNVEAHSGETEDDYNTGLTIVFHVTEDEYPAENTLSMQSSKSRYSNIYDTERIVYVNASGETSYEDSWVPGITYDLMLMDEAQKNRFLKRCWDAYKLNSGAKYNRNVKHAKQFSVKWLGSQFDATSAGSTYIYTGGLPELSNIDNPYIIGTSNYTQGSIKSMVVILNEDTENSTCTFGDAYYSELGKQVEYINITNMTSLPTGVTLDDIVYQRVIPRVANGNSNFNYVPEASTIKYTSGGTQYLTLRFPTPYSGLYQDYKISTGDTNTITHKYAIDGVASMVIDANAGLIPHPYDNSIFNLVKKIKGDISNPKIDFMYSNISDGILENNHALAWKIDDTYLDTLYYRQKTNDYMVISMQNSDFKTYTTYTDYPW